MPFVSRNTNSKITTLHDEAQFDEQEFLPNDDPQIISFLKQFAEENEEQTYLNQSDFELVRVLEDLVDLLTEKHIILFTELPPAAQNKLLQRKSARMSLQTSLISDEEDNIF